MTRREMLCCLPSYPAVLHPSRVIRVWDIVLDHDNLPRAIDQTIERIETSHKRGEECALFAEIGKPSADVPHTKDGSSVAQIPRVFPMSNEVTCIGSTKHQVPQGKSRHYHPASDDPRQYTLLKVQKLLFRVSLKLQS